MPEPSLYFGTNSKFGTLSGWAAQDGAPSTNKQLARVLGEMGDEAASALYDEKTEVSQNFTATSPTSAIPAALKIGAVIGGNVVTGIHIQTVWNDYAKLSLTGHNHAANPHTDTLRQASVDSLALASGWGATEFLGATAGDAVLQSSDANIVCQHVDINGASGDHANGQNYDCVVTVTETWYGIPTVAAGSGWKVTSIVKNEKNTDYVSVTVTAQKSLTLAAPAVSSGT